MVGVCLGPFNAGNPTGLVDCSEDITILGSLSTAWDPVVAARDFASVTDASTCPPEKKALLEMLPMVNRRWQPDSADDPWYDFSRVNQELSTYVAQSDPQVIIGALACAPEIFRHQILRQLNVFQLTLGPCWSPADVSNLMTTTPMGKSDRGEFIRYWTFEMLDLDSSLGKAFAKEIDGASLAAIASRNASLRDAVAVFSPWPTKLAFGSRYAQRVAAMGDAAARTSHIKALAAWIKAIPALDSQQHAELMATITKELTSGDCNELNIYLAPPPPRPTQPPQEVASPQDRPHHEDASSRHRNPSLVGRFLYPIPGKPHLNWLLHH